MLQFGALDDEGHTAARAARGGPAGVALGPAVVLLATACAPRLAAPDLRESALPVSEPTPRQTTGDFGPADPDRRARRPASEPVRRSPNMSWASWYLGELRRQSNDCPSTSDHYRCICEHACRFAPEVPPPLGPLKIRLPYVEVDGFLVTLDGQGRAQRCGHSAPSHHDAAFTVVCEREHERT